MDKPTDSDIRQACREAQIPSNVVDEYLDAVDDMEVAKTYYRQFRDMSDLVTDIKMFWAAMQD